MFEIIPNWHPLFVHFPIALLSMATLFFVLLKFTKKENSQIKTMAYWNLWLGTGFAIVAAIAGWFAYNSVAHDSPSHAAMTEHRNWALLTLSVFIVISIYSLKLYKKLQKVGAVFVAAILLAFGLLASASWHGSEAVYRYGLGVMSLPEVEGEGHAHEHADGEGHGQVKEMPKSVIVNKVETMHDNLDGHHGKKEPQTKEHNHSEHPH